MFFVPDTDPEAWGAGLPGSPVIGFKDTLGPVHVVSDSGWALVGWNGCLGGWALICDFIASWPVQLGVGHLSYRMILFQSMS